jgi:two-component system, OmpR family, KDP operon response regulator KdpE
MSELTKKIIVVENELSDRRFLRSVFLGEGIQVIEADTGREGITLTASNKPDLMILNSILPDQDGISVITEIRDWSQIPIIVLSVSNKEKDKIAALDAGADDYVTKPFGVGELLARVRVAFRHAARITTGSHTGETKLIIRELKIDLERRRVFLKDREIHLTNIEYSLLSVLARNQGKVLTHLAIIREVWGSAQEQEKHPLRVYMAALRRKIEPEPARPVYIITEQGVGYRLVDE